MGATSAYDEPSRVVWASIESEPITVADAESHLPATSRDTSGAIVTFAGVVRDHDGGKNVTELHYEGHPGALAAIQAVAARVAARYRGRERIDISVAHRIGDLHIGAAALVAVVASPHRAAAFTACAELVDEIKAEVPIWKHQKFTDGTEEWVHAIG